jgi:uncharacterized protein (TIGR02246 family)
MTTMTTTPTLVATTVLAQLTDAWNAADGAHYGAAFAEDAHFVTVRGEHVRGSRAIAGGHQGIFDSIYRGSTVTMELDHAREVAPGVVLAVGSSALDVPAGPLQGRHNSRMTLVITQAEDGWTVAALHNTLVAAGA